MEIIKELELTKLMQRDKVEKVASKIFSDERLKEFWSYYDFLSNTAMNLSAKEDKHKIMYSTYYWYTKYKKDILRFMDMKRVLNKKGLGY